MSRQRDWPGSRRLSDYEQFKELAIQFEATAHSYLRLRPYSTNKGMKLSVFLRRQALSPTLLQLPLFLLKLEDFLRDLDRSAFHEQDKELCSQLESLRESIHGQLSGLSLDSYQALEGFLSVAVSWFSSPPAQAYALARALELLIQKPTVEGYSSCVKQAQRLATRVQGEKPSSTVLAMLEERLVALEVKVLLHS